MFVYYSCPSNKAGKGCFGAVLMRDATKVASLCVAMRSGLEQVEQCGNEEQDEVPVTVKCRIGVDDSGLLIFISNTMAGFGPFFTFKFNLIPQIHMKNFYHLFEQCLNRGMLNTL